MKRLISLILFLLLLLTLAACGAPQSASEPAPEQSTEPIRAATPPADEYERAAWYGFIPDELASAEADSAVTWAQYCKMLGCMIAAYDETLLSEWESMTAAAPETQIMRDGAMVSLLFAAKTMGLASFNAGPPAAFGDYAARVWDCVTMDYPVFDWNTPVDLGEGCSDNNHVGPAYDFCLRRVSARSGKSLLEFDDSGDLRLEQPLTLREAALSALRLFESKTPAPQPEASDPQTTEMTALKPVLTEADALRESIWNDNSPVSITGTTYYVSENGNDANDGLTPETAWATAQKVTDAKLKSGDGALFERGSVFRGYGLYCQTGVTYSAYGTGAKPILTGSPENGATADSWMLHGETPDGGKVWVYQKIMRDCGTLVLDGKTGARKIAPYWNGETFATKDGEAFDPLTGLSEDLSFFSEADSLLPLNRASDERNSISLFEDVYLGNEGALYFRCDQGNPGEVFDSIEFSVSPFGAGHALVYIRGGNVIDNLHVYSTSDCGFMHLDHDAGFSTMQNCEISFVGGGVLFYDENGRAGMAGDGLNVVRPSVITNCYFHHNADNAITMEFGDYGVTKNITVSDITVTGNLFEYNFEDVHILCFDTDMKANNNIFKNILIENSYMLYTCGGWSPYIHSDEETGETYGACIKCGDLGEPLNSENIVVRNNTLYTEAARSILYGGNVGNTPPRFVNNRILIPPAASADDKGSVIALWTNDEHNDEGWDSFYWVRKDEVWPGGFSITSCDDFLNRYLGSGNTVEYAQ